MGQGTKKIQKDLIPFWERIGFRIAVGILVPLCISIYALISVAGFYNYFSGSFGVFSERKEKIERQWATVRIKELNYRVKLAELKYAIERYVTGDRRQFRPQVDKLINEFESEVRVAYTLAGDDRRADSRKIYNLIYGTVRFMREYVDQVERQPASDSRASDQSRDRLLLLTGDIENTLKRLKARYELFELQDQERVRAEFEEIRDGVMTMTLFVLVFGLVICGVVTFTITNPINKVISRLRDIATGEGDLTKRIQTRTVGEMRVVALLMNQFLDSLHEIIFTIRNATETINDSVGQVGKQTQGTTISAGEINKNMMSQSMNLEDCSMSLTRIDELLQSTSESTRQAASLSRLAMDRALKGGSSVQETVGAMEKIEESAKKVEFLVSTIQGIATQTNLLAINAAIEASKAGEHGKGFAVVAEEVRKLAERSKGLTLEVTDLITEVNTRMKVGSNLARGAGTALDGIIKDVEAVASLIQRIASASTKQTESSSRLLTAIQTVNQAVRQNLASLQRVSRGAEVAGVEVDKLDGMIGQLNNIVRLFKLRDLVQGIDMEFHGNYGVTRIPTQDAQMSPREVPYDTDEIRRPGELMVAPSEAADLAPAEAQFEAQGAAEEAAYQIDPPIQPSAAAPESTAEEEFVIDDADANPPAAMDAAEPVPAPLPFAIAGGAEAPAPEAAPESAPAAAAIAPEFGIAAAPETPAADRTPIRKMPGLIAAPASADVVEDEGDQSFFTADELSREIKPLKGGKGSGEEVA